MNNLTGQEKFMNMVKLGTVSTGGKHFHGSLKINIFNVLGVTPYTLCEVKNIIQKPAIPRMDIQYPLNSSRSR